MRAPGPDGSDRVPGGFGDVVASRWGSPSEGPVRQLVHLPARLLLEPVVMTTLWAAITQARPAARLKRNIMFEVALAGRSAADRAGAVGVPDLGQVPKLDARVMAPSLEPVVAVLGTQGVELNDQVRPGSGGPQPPGPVPAGLPVPRF